MSSTFAIRTQILKSNGVAVSIKTGYEPSFVDVENLTDVATFRFTVGASGTVKTVAAGTSTNITTTGITWDAVNKAVVLGTDALLCGASGKELVVHIYK